MIQTAMDNFDKDLAESKKVPLPTSVAMSQGYIGIDLQNAIKYELYRRELDIKVSTILSQVEVDENDEAFENPSKPIGRFMTKEEAEEKEAKGIRCMEDAGRGYRVVVASPMPKRIRELETIRTLMNAGHIVITCGGGGIPVINKGGKLVGVNAVIDKDNVSSLLASKSGGLSGDSDRGGKGCHQFWKGKSGMAVRPYGGTGKRVHCAGTVRERLHASEDRSCGALCRIRRGKKNTDYAA